MKIAVLGTGMVGQTISGRLSEMGHEVFLGTRNAEKTLSGKEANRMTGRSFAEWHRDNGKVRVVNYEDLPEESEMFINATNGRGSIEALVATGKDKFSGKTILDIANPLDFSKGMPPSLFISNTDSLAEQIQREFPEARVVKGLNTMNAMLMVDPSRIPGEHHVFLSGNDSQAKKEVRSLLSGFGWKDSMIIDLGDITTARGSEMLLPIWVRLFGLYGSPDFNFHIATG